MYKRMKLHEFIAKSKLIHGDKYEYPDQVFKNTKTKVQIYCKQGSHFFWQLPNVHLLGKGCKSCSKRKTKEEFLAEMESKYGSKFTYDLTSYATAYSEISVTCNDCLTSFTTKVVNHCVARNGCPNCAKEQAKNNIRKSFESFLAKSKQKNGDVFDFEVIETPFHRKSKLAVTCKMCLNQYESYANNILNKIGCPSCSLHSKHPDTEGFVYELLYDGIPINYIGITTRTLAKRLSRHKDAVRDKRKNTPVVSFLRGRDLRLLTIQEICKGKACELADLEAFWISEKSTKFPEGLNKSKGGAGLHIKHVK